MNVNLRENEEEIKILLNSTNRKGMEKVIKYMDDSFFFSAPASSRFHLCVEGGLAQHSLNVYRIMCCQIDIWAEYKKQFENYSFHKQFNIKNPHIDRNSVIIVALLHDICKVKSYVPEIRNKKVPGEKKWYEVQEFKRTYDYLPVGVHGDKSLMIVSSFIRLSVPEMMAIRWHMGAYEEGIPGNSEVSSVYHEAVKNPLVLSLHLADLQATFLLENETEETSSNNGVG